MCSTFINTSTALEKRRKVLVSLILTSLPYSTCVTKFKDHQRRKKIQYAADKSAFLLKIIKYRDYRKNTSACFSRSCSPCIFVILIDKVVSLLEARIAYTTWITDVSNSVKCQQPPWNSPQNLLSFQGRDLWLTSLTGFLTLT